MSFQIHPLEASNFSYLSSLSPHQLASIPAKKSFVESLSGIPCRVSLEDAQIGDTVFLLHYSHHTANSPFKSSHAIYVRENAATAKVPINHIPESILCRLISVRGFNSEGMMLCADITAGEKVADMIIDFFNNIDIRYVHLHYARPGCFAATATRANEKPNT